MRRLSAKWLAYALALLIVASAAVFGVWHFERKRAPQDALPLQAAPASITQAPIPAKSFCNPQTTELLKSRTYVVNFFGDETRRLTFKEGKLSAPKDPDVVSAGMLQTKTGSLISACGDLAGDGSQTNVVALDESDGGSYTLIFIVPVLVQNGQLKNGVAFQLGDRVGVEKISIIDQNVVIDYVGHGPNEPLCCPDTAKSIKLKLVGDRLVCADKSCKAKMMFD